MNYESDYQEGGALILISYSNGQVEIEKCIVLFWVLYEGHGAFLYISLSSEDQDHQMKHTCFIQFQAKHGCVCWILGKITPVFDDDLFYGCRATFEDQQCDAIIGTDLSS